MLVERNAVEAMIRKLSPDTLFAMADEWLTLRDAEDNTERQTIAGHHLHSIVADELFNVRQLDFDEMVRRRNAATHAIGPIQERRCFVPSPIVENSDEP